MNEPVRLSDSRMWQDLRDFYETEGVKVWSSDHIPFFATNNPALAKTYTDLFVAYLEDLALSGLLQLNEAVTIVDVGGGIGRLAFLMLGRLEQIKDQLPVKVEYLLTDYSTSNVDYYLAHEKLQPYLESGVLRVQVFDAEASQPLEINNGNPIFALANYLFDSLSHDGFKVVNGELYEARCQADEEGGVRITFPEAPAKPYSIESYNSVLKAYSSTLGNTHFPFPIGPLRCLEQLSKQSGQRLALVMADKALRSLEELLGFESLPVQKHPQGFSMTVNTHAIDQVWEREGGQVFHSAPRSHPLHVALYFKGIGKDRLLRTQRVFLDQIDGFGPLDYLDFRLQILAASQKTLSLCLQLLRLSHWDAELFYELSNTLGEHALSAPVEQQRELYDVMVRCWTNFYPITDERDVPFAVARVLACISQFEQALSFYGESIRIYGERPLTHHNIGICLFNLGRLQEAREAFESALKLDDNYGPSKELLIRLEAEESRRDQLRL